MVSNHGVRLADAFHPGIGIFKIIRDFGIYIIVSSYQPVNSLGEGVPVTSQTAPSTTSPVKILVKLEPEASSGIFNLRERPVRNQRLNRGVQALFEGKRRITSMISILSSGIIGDTNSIIGGIGTTANVLGAVVTGACLVAQVNMNVRNMNNLDRGLSTRCWTSGVWFGSHLNRVWFNVWPLTQTEDGETEES